MSQTRDTILTNGFRDSMDLFQEKTKNTSNWLDTTILNTNKIQLKNMNTKYLHSVGDFQVQDVFLFYLLVHFDSFKSFCHVYVPRPIL